MNTNIIYMKNNVTIRKALDDYFGKYSKDSFPILDDQSRLLGVVTFKEASNIPENIKAQTLVVEVMIPQTNLIVMPESGAAEEALMKMMRKPLKRVFVCDNYRRLLGLISKTNIMSISADKIEFMKTVKK